MSNKTVITRIKITSYTKAQGVTMETATQFIQSLDDETVTTVFKQFAQQSIEHDANTLDHLTESSQLALQTYADIDDSNISQTSEEEVARLGLELLYDDPDNRSKIEQLVDDAQNEIFGTGIGEAVAVITGALFLLQTHIKFERKENGKFSILVEKKATSNKLLTTIIEKTLGLASKTK